MRLSLVALLALSAFACGPVSFSQSGPTRLPTSSPPTSALFTEGVPDSFPTVSEIVVRRPHGDAELDVALYAVPNGVRPVRARVSVTQPISLADMRAQKLLGPLDTRVEGVGEFVCHAHFALGEMEKPCDIENTPWVQQQGLRMFAIASPAPEFVDLTITYARMNATFRPVERVEPIAYAED